VAGRHISCCVVSLRPFWITRRPPLIFLMKTHQIYVSRCMGFGTQTALRSRCRALTSTFRINACVLTRAA
jgi:hypothetical protein